MASGPINSRLQCAQHDDGTGQEAPERACRVAERVQDAGRNANRPVDPPIRNELHARKNAQEIAQISSLIAVFIKCAYQIEVQRTGEEEDAEPELQNPCSAHILCCVVENVCFCKFCCTNMIKFEFGWTDEWLPIKSHRKERRSFAS